MSFEPNPPIGRREAFASRDENGRRALLRIERLDALRLDTHEIARRTGVTQAIVHNHLMKRGWQA